MPLALLESRKVNIFVVLCSCNSKYLLPFFIMQNMSNTNKILRLQGIDYLKGILIALMVVGHSGCPEWLSKAIYMFHMPCFFIISGFLFSEKHLNNAAEYIKKKFKSLWWPYVLWTGVFVMFHNVFNYLKFTSSIYSHKDILDHLQNTFIMTWEEQMGGTFWFLKALLFASLACYLWFRLLGYSLKSVIGGVIVFLTLTIAIKYLQISYYYITDVNLFAGSYFMIGVLAKIIYMKLDEASLKILKYAYPIILVLLFIGTYFIPSGMPNTTIYNVIPYFCISTAISILCIFTCNYKSKTHLFNLFRCWGENSLNIMIFHFCAFKVVSLVKIIHYDYSIDSLSNFPVISSNNEIYWILYSVIGIYGSLVITLFVSKIKIMIKSSYNALTQSYPRPQF